jgi:hypothetical protein
VICVFCLFVFMCVCVFHETFLWLCMLVTWHIYFSIHIIHKLLNGHFEYIDFTSCRR